MRMLKSCTNPEIKRLPQALAAIQICTGIFLKVGKFSIAIPYFFLITAKSPLLTASTHGLKSVELCPSGYWNEPPPAG